MFMHSETNSETWTVLTIIIIVVCESCAEIPCPLTISQTYTDVNYSTDLWLIFQSPTAEREGFTNSSQTEADRRLTRTVPLLCALTMSYRWGHKGWTTWHPVARGVYFWVSECACLCSVYHTKRQNATRGGVLNLYTVWLQVKFLSFFPFSLRRKWAL